MDSRANASLPILFQPVYSNSTANKVVPWASVFVNMVTKGYCMWTPQILVIPRLLMLHRRGLGGHVPQPGSAGECVREVGNESRRTGAWEHLYFQIAASCSAEETVM